MFIELVPLGVLYKGGFRSAQRFICISALHVQYGIQVFARFKCPESTRFHLRELQSQKTFFTEEHAPEPP